MTDTKLVCWREAVRACMGGEKAGGLAEHLVQLPDGERAMLLEGIDCDELRAAVNSLLRRQQEQLVLV